MFPLVPTNPDEPGDDDEAAGRSGTSAPERFHRRKPAQRTRKRARRSRTTEMAKRGIHRRRNKRVAW
jgi:hypothetical protein